jgi:hypothetical protein
VQEFQGTFGKALVAKLHHLARYSTIYENGKDMYTPGGASRLEKQPSPRVANRQSQESYILGSICIASSESCKVSVLNVTLGRKKNRFVRQEPRPSPSHARLLNRVL